VIGSGPGGQRAAIQAAKLGKNVLVVERKAVVGGVCVNTGTIPSKTMREAALHLSGFRERSIYGASYSVKQHITMTDLLYRADNLIKHEIDVIRHQLQRNGVEMIEAEASFADPHTLRLAEVQRKKVRDISSSKVVIAVGTSTSLDPSIPFDGQRISTSDDILDLKELPRTLAVVGAGVIGCEYATIFAALGVRVTLVDKRPRLLEFVDNEIVEALIYQMRRQRVTLRLGEEVSGLEINTDAKNGEQVSINLKSGKHITAQRALYSIGRSGATEKLGLDHATLTADSRGRIKVNEFFQTEVPNIYAVGDVIGFPSLASASMEQGRLAACHAFGVAAESVPELVPYGIYTIPEISTVGQSEEQLTAAGTPYEVGKAAYREIARGQIIGDQIGLLKLLFEPKTHKLLGVHIIGEGASELIHVGQAVMALGVPIEYFVNTVFNYPTLAECYKTAAFDGINRLG